MMRTLAAIFVLALAASPASGYPSAFLAGPTAGIMRYGHGGSAQFMGGLAVRYSYVTGLGLEAAIGDHTSDSIHGLEARSIPVTLSVVIDVDSNFYIDAGFGWYATTYKWENAASHKATDNDLGWNLGTGIHTEPENGPVLLLDIRYHWLGSKQFDDPPPDLRSGRFDPDFWSGRIGVLFPVR